MFDVTNKLSFDSLDYWFQEFTSNGGKQAVMAVVANKVTIHLAVCHLPCYMVNSSTIYPVSY